MGFEGFRFGVGGFWVGGFKVWVLGSGFGFEGLGFGAWGFEGLVFKVWGLALGCVGLGAWGLGFRKPGTSLLCNAFSCG